jgi:hypothetical protein
VVDEEVGVQGASACQPMTLERDMESKVTDGDADAGADGREGAHGSIVVVTAVTNQGLFDSATVDTNALDIAGGVSGLAVCVS